MNRIIIIIIFLTIQTGISADSESVPVKKKKLNNIAMKTGLLYHDDYLKHFTGKNHPEKKERLSYVITHLKNSRLWKQLSHLSPKPAPLNYIEMVHNQDYIKRVELSCQKNLLYLDSTDTPISQDSYKTALLAAGGVITAIDAIMSGKVKNAFCAIRPPGHHALKERAMGFCIFNNVAIGAKYLQKKHGLKKVLIVDWDVHHGNGTQWAFYEDPTVMFFSIHQYPFYPGTGGKSEIGKGAGKGYTLNVPLSAGAGDREYIKIFKDVLKPAALKFKPDFIIISAGFDAHRDDPIGGMKLTPEGFAELTGILKEIAEKCCKGRIVSVMEGGYNLKGIAESIQAHIEILAK